MVPSAGIASFQTASSSDNNLWQESRTPVATGKAKILVPGYGVVTLVGNMSQSVVGL